MNCGQKSNGQEAVLSQEVPSILTSHTLELFVLFSSTKALLGELALISLRSDAFIIGDDLLPKVSV